MDVVVTAMLVALVLGFAGGFALGRVGRYPRGFDFRMLPSPADERWKQLARVNCSKHLVEHARYQLGEVIVESNCGFYVGTQWYFSKFYANEVSNRQSERLALESWT